MSADAAFDWARDWFRLDRLALNWDQVEQYDPPPNPAKMTDSRGAGYVEKFGRSSWELDALEPTVIGKLIEDAVVDARDDDLWSDALEEEQRERETIEVASRRWPAVATFLEELEGGDDD